MNRSLKEALSLILLLTAIFVQLCQAYPETSATKNEEVTEEFVTDVKTLSQIEEENTDHISEGDLKRQSRKVPCPFHKLKSGLHKAAAIPCGAAAAAVAGKSVGGSIGGTSVGGSIGGASVGEVTARGGTHGRTSFGGSIGGSGTTEVGGGVRFNHLTDAFDIVNEQMLEIGTSLHGAISSLQELLVKMPEILGHLRTEVDLVNAPVDLRYDVVQTCDSYAQAEKGISGIINYIYNFFKLPSFQGGQVQVKNNFEIGSCLDNIKANMMNFLATIRSWFSCDKLFSSNKGISKFESYINSIPSSSQCRVLNGLGKSSGNIAFVPYVSGEGHYAVGGSGGFSANSNGQVNTQINTALIGQQLQEAKAVLSTLERFPDIMNSLIEDMKVGIESHVNTANAAQRSQALIRTVQVPVAPVYPVPFYPQQIRPRNMIPSSISGQTQINIQRVSDIPAPRTIFYEATAQQAPVPAPLICSGQSIIDNVYSTVSASPIAKHTNSHLLSTSVGNINSGQAALDLLNVRVNLSRDTVYTLLMGQMPAAGDIIILHLTNDIMLIGSPSDNFGPITFNFIYRGISSNSHQNNNVFVWNLSEHDFTCNQNIFNDIMGHLVYA